MMRMRPSCVATPSITLRRPESEILQVGSLSVSEEDLVLRLRCRLRCEDGGRGGGDVERARRLAAMRARASESTVRGLWSRGLREGEEDLKDACEVMFLESGMCVSED